MLQLGSMWRTFKMSSIASSSTVRRGRTGKKMEKRGSQSLRCFYVERLTGLITKIHLPSAWQLIREPGQTNPVSTSFCRLNLQTVSLGEQGYFKDEEAQISRRCYGAIAVQCPVLDSPRGGVSVLSCMFGFKHKLRCVQLVPMHTCVSK